MRMRFACPVVVLMSLLAVEVLVADARAADAPAADAFDTRLAEWKQMLRDLGAVRDVYRGASSDEKVAIYRKYKKLIDAGDALLPKLAAAAEQRFVRLGNPQDPSAELLVHVVRDDVRHDRYEEAYRRAKLLYDGGVKSNDLLEAVGVAAFLTSDFSAAEKYFRLARDRGTLTPVGDGYFSQLDYYKTEWKKEKLFRKVEAEADDLPRVKFETTAGDIVIELFENEAPNTVANMIHLVEKKFYDGITLHRVLRGFMAQGGCPNGDGTGGPGYTIRCECLNEVHRKHFRGSLSMAKKKSPHTGGSQFFLTFVPTRQLDGMHTVFGRVIEGIDVLAKLKRRNPDDPRDAAVEPDHIKRATVLRKRDHKYVPKTVPNP